LSTRTSKFHSCLNVLVSLLLVSIVFQQSHSQYRFLENRTPLPTGEDTGFLLDSPTRIKIDLSGEWGYKITGGPAGTVNLPAAADFVGEVTFERSFEVNPDDFGKYQFHVVCLGANYNCGIWINNDFITNHIGGYTSFVAPIPDNVLQIGKENVIRVVTDNRLDVTKTIPIRHGVGGWRNYGGVYRHIYILGTPRIFISDVVASTELKADRSLAKVKVSPTLEGGTRADTAARRFQMYAEVYEKLSGTLVAGSSQVPVRWQEDGWSVPAIECTLPSPKLWDLSSPNLYSVRTYLVDAATKTVIDEYRLTIGVRKLEIADDRVVLNGVVQPLYGVVWYEDHEAYGSALPAAQMEKDVILMKSLGATAVRFAHHPPHPYMLDLCNRYGLLVLEELPLHRVPARTLSQEHFLELALTRLKEMIVRDRNHPCVFAWGLGDEFETSDSLTRRFVEPLAAAARKLDSRPLYYGTDLLSGDVCSDLVDFTALTILSTDPKLFRKKIQDWKIAHPQRLLLLGKVGVEVQPGNENGYSDPLSVQAGRSTIGKAIVLRSASTPATRGCTPTGWSVRRARSALRMTLFATCLREASPSPCPWGRIRSPRPLSLFLQDLCCLSARRTSITPTGAFGGACTARFSTHIISFPMSAINESSPCCTVPFLGLPPRPAPRSFLPACSIGSGTACRSTIFSPTSLSRTTSKLQSFI